MQTETFWRNKRLTTFRQRYVAISNGYYSAKENNPGVLPNKSILIIKDPKLLEKFANELELCYTDEMAMVHDMEKRLRMAVNLINLIQKQYEIK